MDGCTNGDRVDEVRVGHVWQVGMVLCSIVDLERSLCFISNFRNFRKKSFRFGKKFHMKLVLVSYICFTDCIECTSVFVVVVP